MNQLHQAEVGGMGNTKFWSEIRNKKDHIGVLNSDGGIILILILNKWGFEGVGWIISLRMAPVVFKYFNGPLTS
jgi:hypothetical protein